MFRKGRAYVNQRPDNEAVPEYKNVGRLDLILDSQNEAEDVKLWKAKLIARESFIIPGNPFMGKLDSAIWKNWVKVNGPTPTGLKLAGENLQYLALKAADSITDVENAFFDLGVMDSHLIFSYRSKSFHRQ
ncbi:hypothetical protein Tco_1369697 [Tanacetum coccineum]